MRAIYFFNLSSFPTRPYQFTFRTFHGTWILLVHLGLIYALMTTRPSSSSHHSQGEFRSLMRWVSVRINQIENSTSESSERSSVKLQPLQGETKSVRPLNSQETRQMQERTQQSESTNTQTSTTDSSRGSSNKNVDLADPFAVPTDISRLDSAQHRYGVQVPKQLGNDAQVPLTPAQQAAIDVRSNSPKLTKSELFAKAAGTLECIYQARMANGKIIREPGRWIEVPARSEPGQPMNNLKVRFCVRLHQNDDVDGTDLTEISAGLRGK